MKISNRLEKIANLIEPNKIVLDIGTDHAYLPIYLLINNLTLKVIASDNKTGPLSSAKKNIEKYKLNDKINLLLSDGLNNINEHFDIIIIAGMGGSIISKILTQGLTKIMQCDTLILQPNNHAEVVRKFLLDQGFTIIVEEMVLEDKHYYPIIKAVHGKSKLSKLQIEYGPILLQNRSDIFLEYLEQTKNYLISVSKQISNINSSNYSKIVNKINEIDSILINKEKFATTPLIQIGKNIE